MTEGLRAVDAILFDMDGTLIRSDYDWPSIRAELGVEGPSLVDALNALPESRRSEAWVRMREIETRASLAASVVDGARDLVELLGSRGVKTALVTNNTSVNTRSLTRRFGLRFDVVLTRDSGLYKPSSAPLVEAMRRLGVDASRTMAVGDSMYDIRSAREAGCVCVVVVNGGFDRYREAADLAFRDLRALGEFVRRVVEETPLVEADCGRGVCVGTATRGGR